MTERLQAWEVSKENVQPVKAGRDIRALSAALAPQSQDTKDAQKRAWETRLAEASTSPDPLSVWRQYIAWIQQAYTTVGVGGTTGPLLDALERCTRTFKDDARYRNDPEYVKVWVTYADALPDPGEVFKFMHSHRIGEDCALMYMAWAYVSEHRGNYAFADKVYQRGIHRGASPVERLKMRYRQFQRRAYRRWMDSLEAAGQTATAAPASDAEFEATFNATVNLEALSTATKGAQPAEAASRGARGPADENAARAPLTRITAASAGLSHRQTQHAHDIAYVNDRELPTVISNLGTTTSASAPGQFVQRQAMHPGAPGTAHITRPSDSQSVIPVPPPGNRRIEVYEEDEGAAADELGTQRNPTAAPAAVWADFGTEHGRKKENTLAASRWTDGALPSQAARQPQGVTSGAAPATSRHASSGSIPIWEDDSPAPSAAPTAPVRAIDRSARPALLSRPADADAEQLMRNPVARHTAAPQTAPAAALAPPAPATHNAARDQQPSEGAGAILNGKPRPAAAAKPSSPSKISGLPTDESLSVEEIRARAWLSAHPIIASQLESKPKPIDRDAASPARRAVQPSAREMDLTAGNQTASASSIEALFSLDNQEAPHSSGRSSRIFSLTDDISAIPRGVDVESHTVTVALQTAAAPWRAAMPTAGRSLSVFEDSPPRISAPISAAAAAPMRQALAAVKTSDVPLASSSAEAPRAIFSSVPRSCAPVVQTLAPTAPVLKSALAQTAAAVEQDITINTRLAMEDMSDLFSSPGARATATAFNSRAAAVAPAPDRAGEVPTRLDAQKVQPAVRERALPPDARRLSVGIGMVRNRRESGVGLLRQAPPARGKPAFTIFEEQDESQQTSFEVVPARGSLSVSPIRPFVEEYDSDAENGREPVRGLRLTAALGRVGTSCAPLASRIAPAGDVATIHPAADSGDSSTALRSALPQAPVSGRDPTDFTIWRDKEGEGDARTGTLQFS